MNAEELDQLLEKYLEGKCTPEETLLVEQLVDNYDNKSTAWENLDDNKQQVWLQQLWAEIKASMLTYETQYLKFKRFKLWSRIAAAAAVLLIVGLSIFFYTQRHLDGSAATRDLLANDIKPGGNKAYLVLSNGKRVSLTDAANGELAKEAGVEITKTADGQVAYKTASDISGHINGRHPELDSGSPNDALNIIETPRGGQYQIRLPDGSKVWLNAASKLIYPVSFNGRGQRVVELSGEAYFEIFKNKLQPFVVKSKNQEVTVLGTHFNINSYSDEPGTKTTLLEGSVQVSTLQPLALSGRDAHRAERVNGSEGNSNSSLPTRGISPRGGERFGGVVLKPNEQSVLVNGKIVVKQVDPALAVDWKNGQFIFESEPLPSILRRVARWYNVTIIYTNTDKNNTTFSGVVSRADNVSSVLRMLQKTSKIKFTIDGNTVKVE